MPKRRGAGFGWTTSCRNCCRIDWNWTGCDCDHLRGVDSFYADGKESNSRRKAEVNLVAQIDLRKITILSCLLTPSQSTPTFPRRQNDAAPVSLRLLATSLAAGLTGVGLVAVVIVCVVTTIRTPTARKMLGRGRGIGGEEYKEL